MVDTNCSQAEAAVHAVLEAVLERAERQIRMDRFVERSQPVFVLERQREVFESNLKHVVGQPLPSLRQKEHQPSNIAEDNFMNVGVEGINPVSGIFPLKLQSKRKGENGLRQSKRQEPTTKDIKIKSKGSLLSTFQVLFKDKEQRDSYSDVLRRHKQESERIARANQPIIRPKLQCRLGRDQQIVFDYEGNFTKRKESPTKDFTKAIIEGTPIKTLSQAKKILNYQQTQLNSIRILAGSKLNDKSQISKLRTSQQQQNRQIFSLGNKKEDLINSIKITSPGIKVVVDGDVVSCQPLPQPQIQSQLQKGQKIQKGKTVGIYRAKQSLSQRFKTEALLQSDIILPSTKRKTTQRKTRTGTEVSQYQPSILGRISVENQSLHKMVINQEDLESRYMKIPSKQGIQRRIKTNIESSSVRRDEDLQKLKIKERLTSLTKEGDRLPKILNHHRRAEIQIYKEFRSKLMGQQ